MIRICRRRLSFVAAKHAEQTTSREVVFALRTQRNIGLLGSILFDKIYYAAQRLAPVNYRVVKYLHDKNAGQS